MSTDGINVLMEYILEQLGISQAGSGKKDGKCQEEKQRPKVILTPQKAAVIVGLLTDALQVKSILVNRDQTIEIILDGSLKRKTPLDKALEVVGPFSFDEVMRAITDRLG